MLNALKREYIHLSRDKEAVIGGIAHGWIQRGDRGFDPPGKSQVTIGFLRNTGLYPPREAKIGPIGSRSNMLKTKKKICQVPHLTEFSGSAHGAPALYVCFIGCWTSSTHLTNSIIP